MYNQNNDNINMDMNIDMSTFEANAEQNFADINSQLTHLIGFEEMEDYGFMENETGFHTPVAPAGGYHLGPEYDVRSNNYPDPYHRDASSPYNSLQNLNESPYNSLEPLNESFEQTNAEQSNLQSPQRPPQSPPRLNVNTTLRQVHWEEYQNQEYQNQILNEFDSPVTPLHVIDQYNSPQGFQQDLHQLLVDELKNQNASGSRVYPVQKPRTPPRLKALTSTGKESKNKRPQNIANLDPSNFYDALPGGRPCSWGPINPDTGEPLFQYTKHGELTVGQEFSTQQFMDFLFQNPAHGKQQRDRTAYREYSNLTIWIQNPPADSSKRYPTKGSDKCRWADCPIKDHTIHKGFYRVAFDERSREWAPKNIFLDPYHNAGYMHLFCFEKMLDFPSVSKYLNVVPDTREFREGKNRMAITRDHKYMEAICNEFISNSESWNGERGLDSQDWYSKTLSSALTEYQIAHYPNRVHALFEARGGNNISVHRGNCDVYAANELIKERKPMRPRAPDAKKPGRKRKVREPSPEDEFIPDPNILGSIDSLPSKRPAKRPRRSF